ncbi:MAG: hypothetical protein Q9159_003121 [Coniocarpon cinnabarinum]
MSTIRERVYGPISQAPPKYFYIYFKSLKSKGAIESLRIQRRQHHFIRKLMRNALWGETYTRITFDGDGSRALVEAPYADGWQRALSRNPTKLLTDNGWKFFAGEEYPRFEPKDWDMTPVEIDQGGTSNAGSDASSDTDSDKICIKFNQLSNPRRARYESILDELMMLVGWPWEYGTAHKTAAGDWILDDDDDDSEQPHDPRAHGYACGLLEAHGFVKVSDSPTTYKPKSNEDPPREVAERNVPNGVPHTSGEED